LKTPTYWHAEHRNIEWLLDFLNEQLSILHDGGRPEYRLIFDVVSYLLHFSDRYHHARENVAFGYLAKSDPGMRAQLDRLMQEHSTLTSKGVEVCTLLSEVVVVDLVQRAKAEVALYAYLTSYRNHIAAEEKDILPRAVELLTSTEWSFVARAAPPGPDPFRIHGARRHNPTFGSEAEDRYREMCREVSISRSIRSSEHPIRNLNSRRETHLIESGELAGPLSVPRRKNLVPSNTFAWRLLIRQSVMLLALVLAYLQYYLVDVYLQITVLPSVHVVLFGY
jgi:hemerythrin-like domain-containing protein